MTIRTRIITLAIATIAAITLSSTHASAQPYLEFTVTTSGPTGSGNGNFSSMIHFVVDASDPDQTVIPSTIHATSSSPANESLTAGSVPIQMQHFRVEDGSVFLTYTSTDGSLNGLSMIFHEGGPSQDPDESLPDDPAVYTGWPSAVANSSVGGFLYQLNYDNGFTSSGIFNLSVREVPDPNPSTEPECLVDLNNDGVLDFFDISTFLTLFGAGCP